MSGSSSSLRGQRALVLGGSLTGLLAARALAPWFQEVTIVERDPLNGAQEWRKGVPQSRHVHVLLKRGEWILERYFPGLVRDLLASGSEQIDMVGDTRWYYFGGWKTPFRSGLQMLCQTRGFLEARVRARVLDDTRVAIRSDAEAIDLLFGGKRIDGARIRDRRSGELEELRADLVVDATGRGSRAPQWLVEGGFAAPDVDQVHVNVCYASRFYRRPARTPGWKGLLVYPKPPGTKLGVIIPVEGDRWMVTLVGWFGDQPGGSDAEFLAFAAALDVPELYHAIRDAEPVSDVALHRFPSNRRRRYERLDPSPEGFVAIGDAYCSFNPIYGQGMTTGAIGAETLDLCLRDARGPDLAGFSRRFFRRLAQRIDPAWLMTTGEDLRSPEAVGERPRWLGLLHAYTERIHRLTWSNRLVSLRFLEVMHLTRGPAALLDPRVVLAALVFRPTRSSG